MVGLELPVLAMEHMYLLTEDMEEVKQFNESSGKEVPHAMDFDGELYLRQEQKGMLMGTYEKACVPWQPDATPWDFSMELLPPDLNRITPSLEVGFQPRRPGAIDPRHEGLHRPLPSSEQGEPRLPSLLPYPLLSGQ